VSAQVNGHDRDVDVTGRYQRLMTALKWTDEWTPEARILLDLVTAVETYRERSQHHARIVELTASQVTKGLEAPRPNLARLVPEAAEADTAMAAFTASAELLEKFLSVRGLVE
jgi:hypothetical protein